MCQCNLSVDGGELPRGSSNSPIHACVLTRTQVNTGQHPYREDRFFNLFFIKVIEVWNNYLVF